VQQDQTLVKERQAAQDFLTPVAHMIAARVLLLSKDGIILGSTRPDDASRIGTRHPAPAVDQALHGLGSQGIGPGFRSEVAYVVLPIRQQGVPAGALRLSYEVDDVQAEFHYLRWLIVGGVSGTAILGLGLGLALATTVIQPLRQLTGNVQQIAGGNYQVRVAIQRRDEVGLLAQSFNQMAAQLEEGERARERQLAAIAHELARPLTGMRAAVETLHGGADTDAEMRELLFNGLEEELARLERLIGTLQGVHQRALRPVQLHRTEVSLDRIIRASVTNFEPMAVQAGITLAAQLPPALPKICADEDRLIQVLTNLLDNALKFTPRGGQVRIEAGKRAEAVWISVADTGVGITAAELPHIFQQFYRGEETRPAEKRGMGLGLAICQEIMTAHHGEIQVDSEPGRGTRFTLTLPKE
jgi:two-component system OmpR family sensor kinase